MQTSHTRSRSAGAGRRVRSITDLYADFEQLHSALQAVPDNEGAGKERWESLLNECCAMAMRIAKARAVGIDEMLLKIRVTAWDVGDFGYEKLENLDHWRPGRLSKEVEFHALATLQADLRRYRKVETDLTRAIARPGYGTKTLKAIARRRAARQSTSPQVAVHAH